MADLANAEQTSIGQRSADQQLGVKTTRADSESLSRDETPRQTSSMEYPVAHRCGHEQRHAIFRTFAAEADREVARLARRNCTSCQRAQKQAAERQLAISAEIALGAVALTTLIGSAKQVEWAEKIRLARIASLQRAGHRADTLGSVIQAKWWIDNRDRRDTDLLTLCMQAPA